MLAAFNGHPSTVQKLLAAGADPTLKNKVRGSRGGGEGGVGGKAGRAGGVGRRSALSPPPPAAASAPASGLA